MKYVLTLILLLSCGCGQINKTTANLEQDKTEANQSQLLKNQPPVRLTYSLERENINKRTELWNDPTKVSYIYLVNYGKVMAFYAVKGKVSSVNSQITNPAQLAGRWLGTTGGHLVEGVLPSPAEDGSYGTNGDAVFFFTTDGTYVEWMGDYMLCDKPLRLSTPPTMILEVTD